jgi:hypothetical protein
MNANNLLVPPIGFTYLEDRLLRCSSPFSKLNAHFCLSVKVERVLNYSGKALDPDVTSVFTANGIKVVSERYVIKNNVLFSNCTCLSFLQQDVKLDLEEHPPSNLKKFQEWLAICVEDIISQYSHACTLIVGRLEYLKFRFFFGKLTLFQ